MGLHSAEARSQPAGTTKASDRTIPGHRPRAEAQGIHEERRGLGEDQDKHTWSFLSSSFPGAGRGDLILRLR